MNGLTFVLLCTAVYVYSDAVPSADILYSLSTLELPSNREPKYLQTPYNSNEIDAFDTANICASETCVNESISIMKYMDPSVDPCLNFYNFVCGKYLRETILSEDKSSDLSFYKLGDNLREQLRNVLTEDSQPNEPHAFRLAKDFTKICLNEEALNAAGIEPMKEFLNKYGGWPVVKGENEWNEDNWDWLAVKRQIFDDGLLDNLILEFSIRPDDKDSSKRALFIDRPDFGLSEKFLLDGLENANVRYYYSFMVDTAIIFGANRSNAEREMYDALEFETNLAKISLSVEERRDISVTSNVFNVTTLQETFPYLNWLEYINWNLNNAVTVYEDEPITIPDLKYLELLDILLQTTPKRTIMNYFAFRLVSFSSDLLNDDLHQRQQQYISESTGMLKPDPRITECIKKTTEFLQISTAATYIRKYFNKESKDAAILLASSIHKELIRMLKNTPWMDEKTRSAAIEKANAIGFNIAYPDELTDDNKLEEYYRELQLQPDSLLHSVLRVRNFLKNKKIQDFRAPIVKNDWRVIAKNVAEVDAFYYPSWNSVCRIRFECFIREMLQS